MILYKIQDANIGMRNIFPIIRRELMIKREILYNQYLNQNSIMDYLEPKLPQFNRIKSADNVPGLKSDLERQLTKESLLANEFNWIIEPKIDKNHQLYGGLALGSFKMVEKQEELNRLNFGAVVSVFKQKNLFINPKIKHLRVFVSEHSRQNFNSVFTSSSKFINSNLAKTNVLIYSQGLNSRSPLIVAAFLMREEGMTAKAAIQMIQKKRRAVYLNEPFYKELTQYEKALSEKTSENQSQMCEIM